MAAMCLPNMPIKALLRRYVPGPGVDETIVWYEGAGLTDRRWLHTDERGSVVAVTDASGAAIAITSYDEIWYPGGDQLWPVPIYRQQVVAGAWHVLLQEPHCFPADAGPVHADRPHRL